MRVNKKILLIVAGILIAGLAVGLVYLSNRPTSPTQSAVTPSPSFEAERKLIEKLSRDLAVRYFNYTRPDTPEYLEGIRPYLTAELYQKIVSENQRASRFPDIPPVSSEVTGVTIQSIDQNESLVEVTVNSNSSSSQYEQRARIHWKRVGERWSVVSLLTNESDQNREKYGT